MKYLSNKLKKLKKLLGNNNKINQMNKKLKNKNKLRALEDHKLYQKLISNLKRKKI